MPRSHVLTHVNYQNIIYQYLGKISKIFIYKYFGGQMSYFSFAWWATVQWATVRWATVRWASVRWATVLHSHTPCLLSSLWFHSSLSSLLNMHESSCFAANYNSIYHCATGLLCNGSIIHALQSPIDLLIQVWSTVLEGCRAGRAAHYRFILPN